MALVFPRDIKNTISVGRQLKRHNRFQILLALLYLLNSIYEHSLKATAINRPVNADHCEEKMCQTNGRLSAFHYVSLEPSSINPRVAGDTKPIRISYKNSRLTEAEAI
jgi:hypothetical protein